MPTIPLFDRSAAPGTYRRVVAPGGYECWAFDAEDPATDTQLSVLFATGSPQDASYLEHHARYKRVPTTTAPPLPADYGGVLVRVYCAGVPVHVSYTRATLTVGTELAWGRNRLSFDPAAIRLHVEADGTTLDLQFSRDAVPLPSRPVLRFLRKAVHEWTPVLPRSAVTGSIALAGATAAFAGVGSHEYAFGTSPICYGVARLLRGRVFTADKAVVFHIVQPSVAKADQEVAMVSFDSRGVVEVNRANVATPLVDRITFGDQLSLSSPQIVHGSPRGQRIVYAAEFQDGNATAHCDVYYPQPPRLPLKASVISWLLLAE